MHVYSSVVVLLDTHGVTLQVRLLTVLLLRLVLQARNEGRDLAREGGDIIRAACKWSPELASACEVWKEIKFEFEAVDTI